MLTCPLAPVTPVPMIATARISPSQPLASPRRKTASGGLGTVPRLRAGRWPSQPTDAPRKMRPGYGGPRRVPHLPQSKHDYTVERDLRCSANGGFEALKDSGGAPFVDPIPDGINTRNISTIGQPITQLIDSGSRTVTNVTGDTHFFRYGTVTLSITPRGAGSSHLTIRGVGTNTNGAVALLNQLSGPVLFSNLASDIQRKCSIRK